MSLTIYSSRKFTYQVDVKFIVSAAGKAEKAVNYILDAVKAEDDSEPAIPFC